MLCYHYQLSYQYHGAVHKLCRFGRGWVQKPPILDDLVYGPYQNFKYYGKTMRFYFLMRCIVFKHFFSTYAHVRLILFYLLT